MRSKGLKFGSLVANPVLWVRKRWGGDLQLDRRASPDVAFEPIGHLRNAVCTVAKERDRGHVEFRLHSHPLFHFLSENRLVDLGKERSDVGAELCKNIAW